MRISLKRKINIFGTGLIISLMLFGMIEVVYAFITSSNYIRDLIDSKYMLVFIIFTLQSIAFSISIIVSIRFTDNIRYISVLKNVLWSYFWTNVIIISLAYITIIYYYPNVFSNANDILTFIGIFPQVIIDFSIYILPHPFFLFVLTTVIYYIIYIFSIDLFYDIKIYQNKKYKPKYIKESV